MTPCKESICIRNGSYVRNLILTRCPELPAQAPPLPHEKTAFPVVGGGGHGLKCAVALGEPVFTQPFGSIDWVTVVLLLDGPSHFGRVH